MRILDCGRRRAVLSIVFASSLLLLVVLSAKQYGELARPSLPTQSEPRPRLELVELSSRNRLSLQPTDLLITVKTTQRYHATRLDIVLKTWFKKSPEQVRSENATSLIYEQS